MELDDRRRGSGRWGLAAALFLAVGAAGCDSLLEVDLPSAVTSDDVENAATAPILANSVMAQFECGYAGLIIDASGMEDNFQMVSGVAGNYSQYTTTPGGGGCGADNYSQGWYDPMLIGRAQGYSVFNNLRDNWTSVPNRERLMAQTAFYVAAILDVFGEYWCEQAIDSGPLLTPDQTLATAEGWVDSVFASVTAAGGDFAIETLAGTHTTSIMTAAYGLRARIRWARATWRAPRRTPRWCRTGTYPGSSARKGCGATGFPPCRAVVRTRRQPASSRALSRSRLRVTPTGSRSSGHTRTGRLGPTRCRSPATSTWASTT